MKKIACRIVSVLLLLAALGVIIDSQETFSIIIFTLLLIGGYALWLFSSSKGYNENADMNKMVEMPHRSLQDICRDLQAIDTPLGSPWLCQITAGPLHKDAIVFGPNEADEFVYGCWSMGNFFLTGSTLVGFLQPSAKEAWHLEQKVDNRKADVDAVYDERINLTGIMTCYQKLFEIYGANGKVSAEEAAKVFAVEHAGKGEIYAFEEDFKLTGQRFFLVNKNGETIYDIEGTWPFKNLYIRKPDSDELVFRMTRRLFHLLPYYDFYTGADKSDFYGSFRKKFSFVRDVFVMEAKGEKIIMRSVLGSLGKSYTVQADGRQIGTIGENIAFDLSNLLFDNMVIEVKEPKYTLLMAALGIMSAREMSRDRTDIHNND